MKVVSAWSIMESFLSGVFVQMLGANPAPAVAMFNALTSTAAQTAALRALAQTTLSRRDQELFEAVLIVLKSAADARNKVAHWVWGYCSSLPDAVLLCDPRALTEYRMQVDYYNSRILPRTGTEDDFPEIPKNRIHVWERNDFIEAVERIDKLSGYIHQFAFILRGFQAWPPDTPEDDQLYTQLCNEPAIQKALSRLRKGQSSPKEPQSPPQQGGKPKR